MKNTLLVLYFLCYLETIQQKQGRIHWPIVAKLLEFAFFVNGLQRTDEWTDRPTERRMDGLSLL